MIKLNNDLLIDLGLGSLSPDDKGSMLAHLHETLEARVGLAVARQMTKEQLDEFESIVDSKDEEGAFTFLEGNFPHWLQIVAKEFERLKAEVRGQADQIVAATQSG